MDEGGAHAGVTMTTEQRVGVAVTHRTLTALVYLVIACPVGVEGGGMVEDVGHTGRERERFKKPADSELKPSRIGHASFFFNMSVSTVKNKTVKIVLDMDSFLSKD